MRSKKELPPYGKEIKHRLIELNMTQVELANEIGCSKQYLQKIIRQTRSGTMYIDHINQILGITMKP